MTPNPAPLLSSLSTVAPPDALRLLWRIVLKRRPQKSGNAATIGAKRLVRGYSGKGQESNYPARQSRG